MAQSDKRKKRPIRPPFLITIASTTLAVAMAPACGGHVGDVGEDGGSGAGGAANTGGSGGIGGSISKCPFTEPAGGSECATAGQSCSYPYCDVQEGVTYRCVSVSSGPEGEERRQWVGDLRTSCNPPPPSLDSCPTEEPTQGTGCYVNPSLSCPYVWQHCCSGDGVRNYTCANYAWLMTSGSSCAMTISQCPPTMPREGDPCCFDGPSPTCLYCEGGYDFNCDEGRWRRSYLSCNPPYPYGEEGSPEAGAVDASPPSPDGPAED